MPGWFILTVKEYNKSNTPRIPDACINALQRGFVIQSEALEYDSSKRQRLYFPRRVPDVSGDAVATVFKAWIDREVLKNGYIKLGEEADVPPPAVTVIHPVVLVPPPAVYVPVDGDGVPKFFQRARDSAEDERRRQEEALIHSSKEREESLARELHHVTKERDQLRYDMYESRNRARDELNDLRAEMHRLHERTEASLSLKAPVQQHTHQHLSQTNVYMTPPTPRGPPKPRPKALSLLGNVSLTMAKGFQTVGKLLTGDQNALLSKQQRELVRKYGH
jgi:hypothetical protein